MNSTLRWLISVFWAGIVASATSALADPKTITRVPPVFPAQASNENIQGMVSLSAQIAADGAVSNIQVTGETPSGYGFGTAATAALSQWTFAPGQPGTYATTMNFTLEDTLSLKDYLALPEAPARVDELGPAIQSLVTQKAGVDGYVDVAFKVDKFGIAHKIETVNVVPGGYDFELAAIGNLIMWRFPEEKPGRYRMRIAFNHLTSPAEDLYRTDYPTLGLPDKYKPKYPPLAEIAGMVGEVSVAVTLGENGTVDAVEILSETPVGYGFGRSAEIAFNTAVYPATTKPGRYKVEVKFRFWR